jgi:hypothetical protein
MGLFSRPGPRQAAKKAGFRRLARPGKGHYTFAQPRQAARFAPFVYRLGRHPFTVERAVRFR